LALIKTYRPMRRPEVSAEFVGHLKQSSGGLPRAVLMDRNDHTICIIGRS
jgi:hypothetical protein